MRCAGGKKWEERGGGQQLNKEEKENEITGFGWDKYRVVRIRIWINYDVNLDKI